MLPSELQPEGFASYPPQARQLGIQQIPLLRQLPLAFLPLLLREVVAYDWKFPMERRELEKQFAFLAALTPSQLQQIIAPFAGLQLSPALEKVDWVNAPAQFSEQLTAHLWATRQIDRFRAAAVEYVNRVNAAAPDQPLALPRVSIVLLGQGVSSNAYPLFRKLRPHGVYFKRINPEHGKKSVLEFVTARAAAHPVPFAHWYLDGDVAEAGACPGVSCMSYRALQSIRTLLLSDMTKVMQSGAGPELLRSKLARLTPEELGIKSATNDDAVFHRFQLSVLTEGSGTQIYSTSFVQWSAREVLRRAQPATLLARFTPRLREQSIKEILSQDPHQPTLDPEGALRDADMGAYYTWINLGRLPGAEKSSFLVWFEEHQEALAIGPALPRATESNDPLSLEKLLQRLS